MEFDEGVPDAKAKGGNRAEPDSANEHGYFITPLDQIRRNAVGSSEEHTEDADGGDTAESKSDGDGAGSEEFGTELATAAEETLARLFDPKGKHPFLNDRIIEEFAQNLRTCIFQELAAIEAGISVNSLKEWLRQGRIVHEYLWDAVGTYDGSTEYGKAKLTEIISKLTDADWMVYKLYKETQKAKAAGERDDLDFIARARFKDWKAAAYRLKIRDRQTYADTQPAIQNNIHTGDVNQSLTVVDFSEWMKSDDGESLEVEATDVEVIDPQDERTSD